MTCIKFDKNLTKLFDYSFFITTEKSDPKVIFEKHLKNKITNYLNEGNYLQIGKALRYGFNNNIEMELNVTKLYLETVVKEYSSKSRKEEKKEYNKKIRAVLDMMDAELIRYDYASMQEILSSA